MPGMQVLGAFTEDLEIGDRVWAPWSKDKLFAGFVERLNDEEVLVHYDDGCQGWVLRRQVHPLFLTVGLRVLGRWQMGWTFYPGAVTLVDGNRIHIQYDDGDREWTTVAALAMVCQPTGPDVRAIKSYPRWVSFLRASGFWVLLVGIIVALLVMRLFLS